MMMLLATLACGIRLQHCNGCKTTLKALGGTKPKLPSLERVQVLLL
ncbi:hypothetical protein E2C01_054935 [Portunus trituberculatus]|uniref:Uncharacterized protein n=1 Tax=Portunus trituberculatus TaxID=210409 RepID=A0A5B7GTI4_PORTR|nr:hypothetical protein [Portunus trituberculatus]